MGGSFAEVFPMLWLKNGEKGKFGNVSCSRRFFFFSQQVSLQTLWYINRAVRNPVTPQVRTDILKGKFPLNRKGRGRGEDEICIMSNRKANKMK